MKTNTLIWGIILLVALGGLLYWGSSNSGTSSGGEIVSRNGLHWHPTLSIYVDGVKQELPGNVGLTGGHYPIHTHTEDAQEGILHLEFGNITRTRDLQLKNFFRVWGNKEVETAFGILDRMLVNGVENTEYGDYVIKENDSIDLFYTTANSLPEGDSNTSLKVPAPGVDPNTVDEMIVETDGPSSDE